MQHRNLKMTNTFKNSNPSAISELPQQNNKSQLFTQTIQPKKGHQTDKYQGPIDPITRLRHGYGKYHYSNKHFIYQGNYKQGIKEGEGTLLMSDGTKITGTFQDNQLIGPAQITYSNGSTYKGELYMGQKNGEGIFTSPLQEYKGQFQANMRHGKGTLKTRTCTIQGTFANNKPHGETVSVKKYNYEYVGGYEKGQKSGQGKQTSKYYDDKYQYEGEYSKDLFDGKGKFSDQSNGRNSSDQQYIYEGVFKDGKPVLYPNQFRISIASCPAGTLKEQQGQIRPQQFTDITNSENPIEYQVQSQSQLYFLIESCYQGPEQLDPNQPTQEEIDKMIKDWEAQNKKNKNPPPMPNFNEPRMIKPQLVLVQQELKRPLEIKLAKGDVSQEGDQTNPQYIKIDYRQLLVEKREQNQQLKVQNAKKAEEQGAKKGGKGGAKGGDLELKLNCYVEDPSEKEKVLKLCCSCGKANVDRIQFPDDIPQANYHIVISSPFSRFGQIKTLKKCVIIKAKNAGGKKK